MRFNPQVTPSIISNTIAALSNVCRSVLGAGGIDHLKLFELAHFSYLAKQLLNYQNLYQVPHWNKIILP